MPNGESDSNFCRSQRDFIVRIRGKMSARVTFIATVVISLLTAFPVSATNLTGTFKNPDGSLVNGKLIFLLSQPARLSDNTAQIVPMVKIFSVTNGALESGAFIYGNDSLVPAGTYYLVRLVDNSNNLLFEQKWSIQGTNLDLGTLTPTTSGVVLADPLVKNTSTSQSVQGPVTFTSGLTALNLTLNGNLNPGTADSYDLGSTAAPWRRLNTKELVVKGPRPWYDVRAYGAVGDGSTDDRTAIQAAVDACQANGGGGYVYFSPSPTFNYYRTLSALTLSTPPQSRNCVLLLGNGLHINGGLVVPAGWHIEGQAGGLNGAGAFMSDKAARILGQTGTITEAVLKLNQASGSSIKNIDVGWNGTSTAGAIYIKGGANIQLRNVFAGVSASDTTNTALRVEGPTQQVYIYNSVFSSGNQVTSKPVIDVYGVPGQTNAGNVFIEDTVLINHGMLNRGGGDGGFGGIVLNRVLHEAVMSATLQVDSTSTSGRQWTIIHTNQADLAAATGKPLWEHIAGAFPVNDLTIISSAEPIGVGYYVDNTAASARIGNVSIVAAQQNGINLRPSNSRFVSRSLPRQGWGASILSATPSETLGTGLAGAQVTVGMQFPENVQATGFTTGGTLVAGSYSYVVTALIGVNAPHDIGVYVSSGTPYESWISAEVACNVASGTTGRCDLAWDAVNGATSYRIYGRGAYTTNNGAHNKTIFFTSTTASFSDAGGAGTAGNPPRWDRESGNLPIHRLTGIADNWIGGPKLLGIGTFSPAAKVHIVSPATGTVGERIDAFATPTANIWEVRDSAAAIKARITAAFAAEFQSLTLLAAPLGFTSGGTNQTAWTASRCVQVNAGGTALESAAAACGSGGGGDSITVAAVAATDPDFINQAATGTLPATTWTLDTTATPDTIKVNVGAASATDAGVVTTGAQTLAGNKTFTGTIIPSSIGASNYQVVTSATAGADHCAKIQTGITALGSSGGFVDARSLSGSSVCAGTYAVTRGVTLAQPFANITPNSTVFVREGGRIFCDLGTAPDTSKSCILTAKNNLDAPVLHIQNAAGPSNWAHWSQVEGIRIEGNKANQTVRTIATAPTGASRTSGVATITTTVAHGFAVGEVAIVRGVTDTSFNGAHKINTVPTSTTFTYASYAGGAPDTTSGGGTTNAKDADCIRVDQPGENFVLRNVNVQNCRHSGIRMTGILAGAASGENWGVNGSGIGVNFADTTSTFVVDVIKGDCNEIFMRLHGGGVVNAKKIQWENCDATTQEPGILIDGSSLYAEGLYHGGPPQHINVILCRENSCTVGIRAFNAFSSQYTNLLVDEAYGGGPRTYRVRDYSNGFGNWYGHNFSHGAVGSASEVAGEFVVWARGDRATNNGSNNNYVLGPGGAQTFVRVSGPTAEFGFTGLSSNQNIAFCVNDCVSDGRVAVIFNSTAQNMYFEHENAGSDSVYRIVTKTGGRVNVGPNSVAFLLYSKSDNRWHLVNEPYSATIATALTSAMRDSDGDILARQLESTVATGTSPIVVASTTEIANLNPQLWHGKQAIDYSASLDFASIGAQTCSELPLSATGASIGSAVAPVWPAALESGLIGMMYVSAADTIKIRLCNVTSISIDPASQTFGGRLIR